MSDPVYADIDELYDRFAAADIVRLADDTGVLDVTGDGPGQVQNAYDGNNVSGSSAEVDAANDAAESVKDALRDAEAEINSYLQAAYDVPVATTAGETPRIVRRLACDIAHHRLHPDPTDAVDKARDRATKDLEKLARGTMQLGQRADGTDAEAGGSRAGASEGPVTFAGNTLDEWARGDNILN